MKALVGLGNPGPEYAATRHNVGFLVADAFARRHGGARFARGPSLESTTVRVGGSEVLVVKPRTFMNRSGEAVRRLVEDHGVRGEDLLVAHDELDLDLGVVRLKVGGGHGGHNGLRSILEDGSAGDFVRIRLGIRRPDPAVDAAAWVLAPFSEAELGVVGPLVERGREAADQVLDRGVSMAMNEINRRSPAVESASRTTAPDENG